MWLPSDRSKTKMWLPYILVYRVTTKFSLMENDFIMHLMYHWRYIFFLNMSATSNESATTSTALLASRRLQMSHSQHKKKQTVNLR